MFIRGIFYFFALLLVSSSLAYFFRVPFGKVDFFESHGVLFLIFITAFPRLTLLFSSVASGGLIWWLGWLFVPRILVAILATFAYFYTNPILVTISWLVAIGGESVEKRYVTVRRVRRQPGPPPRSGGDGTGEVKKTAIDKDGAIDADFKRL